MTPEEASTLSRVELEAVLQRDMEIGDVASAQVIWDELSERIWQGSNPYLDHDLPSSPSSLM